MRKSLALTWVCVPIALLAVHFGPGQRWMDRDAVGSRVAAARSAYDAEDYAGAAALYGEAATLVPDGPGAVADRLKLRLARADAAIYAGQLPEMLLELEGVLSEAESAETDDQTGVTDDLRRAARSALASAHYHAAWLMRIEGAEADLWTEQTEAARQHFRLLAESAAASGGPSQAYRKDLEATIRLARMDLSDLKALPLPKQCQGTSNCSGKCRSQREGRSKGEGNSKDAREKVGEDKSKGASRGGRPGSGS